MPVAALVSALLAPAVGGATADPIAAVPASAFAGQRHVRTVTLAAPAGQVAVRVRRRCGPGATVRLTIDRRTAIRRRVTARTWRTLQVAMVIPAGRRRVALTVDGGRTAHCRRPLGFGAVRLLAAPAGTSPASGGADTTPPSALQAPASTTAPTTTAPGGTTGTDGGATTPGTSPATPARPKLAWAPPALTAPTTIAVGAGDQTYTLDTTKDYILKLGTATHAGGLGIRGGRNVVIVGGHIALPASSTRAVALGISGAVGTVHVEGVWIDGSSGREFDAIQINAPKATVQLENIRATGLRGSYDTNHTDIVQPWGGVARLRVDRLSGTSNYQGIFDQPDQGPIGPVDLRHVDMAYDNAGAKTGGYLLWLTNGCAAATTTLTDVYVKGRAGSTLGSTVWPPTGAATNCPAKIVGDTASWPDLPVTGVARWGVPPGGSFVTAADAGASYRSPGYG
ncbi:MAG TPA: hypothetical protein VI318_15875 [Baekduia sp.]